jgi:hypothetical protein
VESLTIRPRSRIYFGYTCFFSIVLIGTISILLRGDTPRPWSDKFIGAIVATFLSWVLWQLSCASRIYLSESGIWVFNPFVSNGISWSRVVAIQVDRDLVIQGDDYFEMRPWVAKGGLVAGGGGVAQSAKRDIERFRQACGEGDPSWVGNTQVSFRLPLLVGLLCWFQATFLVAHFVFHA